MRETILSIEYELSQICRNSYPDEWAEDHITFQLMRKCREIFANRIIRFNEFSKIVSWQSFKNLAKKPENLYGDISIIVNIQFSSGEILRGVANIEAKRQFYKGSFESMDFDQLKRIHMLAPHSHLLLYTIEPTKNEIKFPERSFWKSNMWITPTNTAKEILKQIPTGENWKLLRSSFPFTMFLMSRIFWGLDLDFRDEIRNDIESGRNRIIDPAYLAIVNVFYEGQRPIEVGISDLWQQI
jgi:hypothetical protein